MIQRYDIDGYDGYMTDSSDGDYVKYDDHKNAVDELQKKIDDLQGKVDDLQELCHRITNAQN